MKLKYNQNNKLWIPNFGIYNPEQIIEVEDESMAKKMLDTGYFDKVIEEKKIKKINIIKKSKKKGDE